MAKLNDERICEAFKPHLFEGEELKYWAYGVKQPHILLIIVLICLAVLPGVIAVHLLTKHYLIGLTAHRFVVLEIKGIGNATVKSITEYALSDLPKDQVKTSTGVLFTHFKISDPSKPFKADFHRGFSKNNRPHAMAMAEKISCASA